jgi:hypothetical protein
MDTPDEEEILEEEERSQDTDLGENEDSLDDFVNGTLYCSYSHTVQC